MLRYAHMFDVLWLTEIKTGLSISVPGFVAYSNPDERNPSRGGIVLLVKTHLEKFVTKVDMTEPSQIWLSFSIFPNFIFGGCYILVPPIDSDYHDAAILGSLQARLMGAGDKKVVVMGDFNARVWNNQKLNALWTEDEVHYGSLKDDAVNDLGKAILQVCLDTHSAIVNHLQYKHTEFKTDLSFRKRRRWISEIDLCLASKTAVENILDLRTNCSLDLPSDHAPLESEIEIRSEIPLAAKLLERSKNLDTHIDVSQESGEMKTKRGPELCQVEERRFRELCREVQPIDISVEETEDAENAVKWLTDTMNSLAIRAKKPRDRQEHRWDPQQDRWQRLLQCGDDRKIWQAIGWKGKLQDTKNSDKPSDEEFKRHFESLLIPETQIDPETDVSDMPQIPLLDDPFNPMEVEKAIKTVKNKAFMGVATGLFRWITTPILLFITQLLTQIFTKALYPQSWSYNRLAILFKSGLRSECGNYRGISVMDSLAKIYDTVLNRRLMEWIGGSLDKAQAGGQKARGCTEQILTLRLLVNYAKEKKVKLYLLYVDFKKAYDKIPRHKLLECLKNRGCGATMLSAIGALYSNTKLMLNKTTIETKIGVRQGAPTSVLLFIICTSMTWCEDCKENANQTIILEHFTPYY